MYTKISELIWTDTKFKTMSDDSKFLLFYVLTCSHRNVIGLYFLPKPYAMFDLGWDMERLDKGFKELFRNGFINHNNNTNIIFIKNFLKYNPLENPNQVKKAIADLQSIPANGVDTELYNSLETLSKPFHKPLLELLHKRFGKQVDVEVDVEVNVMYPFLKDVKNYPFNNELDLEMWNRLNSKYPKLNIEAVLNDWVIAKMDKPLTAKDNPRSQINTFCNNAVKWGNHIKVVDRHDGIKL